MPDIATLLDVAGDDDEANVLVTALLAEIGHSEVIGLNGILASRGLEMRLPSWSRPMGALRTAEFTIRVVRRPRSA